MKFCWCPKGTFKMGGKLEVKHTRGFWIGKYEVTQREWNAVIKTNPSQKKGDSLPVTRVNWNDATRFCLELTKTERAAKRLPKEWEYRLPTEAQWEYACRAGTTTKYSFGDDVRKLKDYAWYSRNSGGEPHPIGEKKANLWGLHDVHGNVSEWCRDFWHGSLPGGIDPEGSTQSMLRVGKGACWLTSAPDSCGSGHRFGYPQTPAPKAKLSCMGFRVALLRHVAPTR